MKRFVGSGIVDSPRIGIISNDAIGNFVVATPLSQCLRQMYPNSDLVYFGGTRTKELSGASDLFNQVVNLHGAKPSDSANKIVELRNDREFDLIFNMEWGNLATAFTSIMCTDKTYICGPCLDEEGRSMMPFQPDSRGDLWRDQEWISPDLTSKYPFLRSGFIGELFCRLAYFEGEIPPYSLPSSQCPMELPDVLISTAVSLREKLWDPEKWFEILKELKVSGKSVGLLGAPPKEQKKYWKGDNLEDELVAKELVWDWRGKLSMPQVVDALQNVKNVLTVDNGILHLAASGNSNIIGLFRNGIHRLWAPPISNLEVIIPNPNQMVNEICLEQVRFALSRVGLI